MVICGHHAVLTHEFIDHRGKASLAEVSGEAARAELEGFQADTHQGDDPLGLVIFEGAPDRLDTQMRIIAIKSDLLGPRG